MADPELERFAERLMQRVRDDAIAAVDRLAAGEVVGPHGERWRMTAADESARRLVHDVIPEIVDQVLFELLTAIDNDELQLAWRQQDGSFVPLEELGMSELAGWLMGGSDGWRARFSAQRFFDPFADLELDLDDLDDDDDDDVSINEGNDQEVVRVVDFS